MPKVSKYGSVIKVAYYRADRWAELARRLFDENKTYAEWAREQAEVYLAEGKAK